MPMRANAAACATALSIGGGMLAATEAGTALQVEKSAGKCRTHVAAIGSKTESASATSVT